MDIFLGKGAHHERNYPYICPIGKKKNVRSPQLVYRNFKLHDNLVKHRTFLYFFRMSSTVIYLG